MKWHNWSGRTALAFVTLAVAFGLRGAEITPAAAPETKSAVAAENPIARGAHPLQPGPNDGRIALVVAKMLEQTHYSHHALDDEYSAKFFDRYLESLDPQHLHFTQADIKEFDHYRDQLDDLTITRKYAGDASPAFEIFNRFQLRLEQRVAFAEGLLKTEKFQFDTEERMVVNRHEAPYPADLDEAKQLWGQRLHFEYLQEKLAKHGAKAAKKDAGFTATISITDPDTGQPVVKRIEKKPAEPLTEVKKKSEAEEIVDTLARRYARNAKFFKEWDNDDVMQVYLTALAHIYDPHSDYFNKSQADNFAIGMNLALFGIGAELYSDDGYCTIRKLVAGGPADKSKKIKEKDRIVAVAQGDAAPVDAVELSLNKVVQMIRGPKGTEVRLTVQPADGYASDRRVVSLIRDEIKLEDQEVKAKVIEVPNAAGNPQRLGVIDLPSFYAPMGGRGAAVNGRTAGHFTSVDVARLLKKFEQEKVEGVILDLRRNGGGSLEEAVKLTGLFIAEGPVVQVRRSDNTLFQDDDPDPSVVYDGPLIVLTSRFSASASEILAGALQDYGRALIVGDQSTHGKGTVQQVNDLGPYVRPATPSATNDPGQLKVTMSKFYRASGASTQLKGVLPDIVLPSVFNYSKDIGEAALDNPLEWDTIKSAKFEKLNRVGPFLSELLQHSNERLATNQDYLYVREDIEQFRKNQADKTISLNEKQRLKEKEEADARQKARDKERLARKDAETKIYELALKQVDLPGLPLPVQKTNALLAKATAVFRPTAGTGTNSASITPPATAAGAKFDEDDDEEKPAAVDAALEEAERILGDYISLLSRKNVATTRPE